MIVDLSGFRLDIDREATEKYYRNHSLCSCDLCRHLYGQIGKRFPRLCDLLLGLGIDAARPDESGSIENRDFIDYLFVSYTVCGRVLRRGEEQITINEDGLLLRVIIDAGFVPNEQEGDYFVVEVDGIRLSRPKDMPSHEPPSPEKRSRPRLIDRLRAKLFGK